jgi:4-nitrophenyl phosphatase
MTNRTFDTLLIDGDGVLWEANTPMPGFVEFFAALKQLKIQWGLLTNNGTKTVSDYVEKFANFGVTASADQIFSSAAVTASYVHETCGAGSAVYVIGQSGLIESLASAGFEVHSGEEIPSHVDAVVVGVDRAINYGKIRVAMRLIRAGALFIATNPDPTFPTPDGLDPGAGSIVAAVATASGKQPVMMGKPESEMFYVALKHLGTTPERTAMLGDRLDTDIAGARGIGLHTILVLSGVTRESDLDISPVQPDRVMQDIQALTLHLLNESAN